MFIQCPPLECPKQRRRLHFRRVVRCRSRCRLQRPTSHSQALSSLRTRCPPHPRQSIPTTSASISNPVFAIHRTVHYAERQSRIENLVGCRVGRALLALWSCSRSRNRAGRRGCRSDERLDAGGRAAAEQLEHSAVAAREQMREQWEAGVGVHVTGVGCTGSAIDAADERLVLLVEREDR